MESGADFQQRSHTTSNIRPSPGRPRHPRQEPEEPALPRTVAANETENLSLLDLERYVLQSPNVSSIAAIAANVPHDAVAANRQSARENVSQRPIALSLPDTVSLAYTRDTNDRTAHELNDID